MITGDKKEITFRKWFYVELKRLSVTVFKNEDDEYFAVQKFRKGIWDIPQCDRTFDKNEMILIEALANDYYSTIYY